MGEKTIRKKQDDIEKWAGRKKPADREKRKEMEEKAGEKREKNRERKNQKK